MRNTLVGLVLAAVLVGGLFFAASHRAKHTVPGMRAPDMKAIADAASMVKPGFVGLKHIGAWELACSEKPVLIGSDNVPSTGDQPASTKPASEEPKATEVPLSLGRQRRRGLMSEIPPVPSGPARPAATEAKPAAAAEKAPEKTPEKTEEKTVEKKVSLGRCRSTMIFRKKGDPKKVVLSINFRVIGETPGKLGLFIRMPAGKKGDTVVLQLDKGGFKLPVSGCGKAGCLAVGVLAPGSEKDLARATKGQLLLPPGKDGKREAVTLPFAGLSASLSAIRRAQT